MLERARSPLPWLGGLLALYLLAPIVAFVVRLHSGLPSAPGLGAALATSLLTATVATALIALLGVPLAYVLAHLRGARARLALALVSLPLALPPLVSGLLLLYVLGPYTALGEAFDGQLTDTRLGVVLAQTFVASPFLVLAARAAFVAVDPALEDVARVHGYRPLARFWRVAVPAALPGIGAGLMLAWLRSFGEFGATVILAYHPYTLPVFTFVQFGSAGLPATTAPIAAALLAALAFVLLSGLSLPRRRAGGPRRRSRPAGLAPCEPTHPPYAESIAATLARSPDVRAANSHRQADGCTRTTDAAGGESPPALDFDVHKRLGEFSLALAHRASSPRLALLGSSGAGKTLTLRLLAGLTAGEGGHVRAGASAFHTLRCEQRGIGYVPQQSALVPRRGVWRQICAGPRARPELAAFWLERLGLAGLEHRRPEELSGGQQRRVALARALATAPRLLLLDEPFTGLDAPVRDRLRRDLRRLQRELQLCTVIVTHDPEEAAMLAEEIIVIDAGRPLQTGTRSDVFRAPASPHVAALLGIANAHRGRVPARGVVRSDGVDLRAATGELQPESEVIWCVRPEHVHALAGGEAADLAAAGDRMQLSATARPVSAASDDRVEPPGVYRAVLLDDIDLGATHELTVALGGALELTARTADPPAGAIGAQLLVQIAPHAITVWPSTAEVGHLDLRRPALSTV